MKYILIRYFVAIFAISPLCPLAAEIAPHIETTQQIPSDPFSDIETVKNTSEPLPSMESLFIKTGFLLLFIITALFSLVWIVKRVQRKFPGTAVKAGERHIELIERSYLSSKTVIWYARIDDIPYAIIEGQHGVALCQIQKPINIQSERLDI